jgi:dihydroxyacid dehydratase/phosphogluconate dehydratase
VSSSEAGITPRDILTKKAFENAITVTIALGGSTNAVLHLLAIAHAARSDWDYRTSRASESVSRCSPTCVPAAST